MDTVDAAYLSVRGDGDLDRANADPAEHAESVRHMNASADGGPVQEHAGIGINRRNLVDHSDIRAGRDWCRRGNIRQAIQIAQQVLTGSGRGGVGIELKPPGTAVILNVNRRRRSDCGQVDGISEAELLHLQGRDVDGERENKHQCRHQQDCVQDALAA